MKAYLKSSVAIPNPYPEVYYIGEPEWVEDEDSMVEDPDGIIHLLIQSYYQYSAQDSYRDISLWDVPHALGVL